MNISVKYRFGFLLVVLLTFASLNIQAENALDAIVTKIKINQKMLVNKSYTAKITVRNTGATTWTRANGFALAATSKTNELWNIPRTLLESNERIKPGDTKDFKINIQALSRTGIYSLQFEMQKDGRSFGKKSKTQNIVVETRSNRVKFISQLLPNTMAADESYSIVVQFKNNGTSTWTRNKGYKLRLISKKNVWNISRVKMSKGDIVTPGDIATFRFKLTAPGKMGTYPIQWRMQRGRTYFGEATPVQNITVTKSKVKKGAEFVYQNVPGLNKSGRLFAILNAGEVYPVTLTFKNSSKKPWRQGLFALSAQNPENNMTWSVDRVELHKNETIKPNGIKTFNFKIITPLKPGIYNFQWQMVEGFNNWIGAKSENIAITVK